MRNFIEIDCEQRSPEWFAARAGRLTGSQAADMLKTIKSGEAADRRNLRVKLTLERVTGKSLESGYQSEAMRQGIERECDAISLYEALTGRLVRRSGFLAHTSLMAGTSLDGYVGDYEGIIEAKCPLPATHLEYLKTGTVPTDYLRQCQHALWLTGAAWCDWLSYGPEFPEDLQSKIVRIERDETAMKSYELLLRQFLAEVDAEVENVKKLSAVPA